MATLAAQLGLEDAGYKPARYLTEAGYFLFGCGHVEEAASAFEGARLLAPQDPVPHTGLAEVFLAQGKPRKAERAATRACDTVSEASGAALAYAWLIRGDARMQLGQARQSVQAWRNAIHLDEHGPAGRLARGRLSDWNELQQARGADRSA